MNVDGSLVDIDITPPYAVEELLARINASGVLHQKLQQTEFRRPQHDLAIVARYALFLPIKLDISDRQCSRIILRTCPPQKRSDPSKKFRQRKWFDDVIVRPGR